ncbi:MAG TPA: beta-ketoacyl synthase N-terminal-like domain-containing protein [Gemmatimonadaceae bacterium]|nr:beta-ketoacyl synthase N-terminal-like domain-containing protein [Gemmatimonadaceae bacterium]
MTAVGRRLAEGEPIAITGVGLVSSLGADAVSSCAAARAGLSRPQPIEDAMAWDEAEADSVPVHGHAVRHLTQGFAGLGRLARLGVAAWEDLDRNEAGTAPARYGLYIATSDGYYTAHARGQDEQPPTRDGVIADIQLAHRESIAERLPARLVALRGKGSAGVTRALTGQHASFAAALIDAVADLRAGAVSEAIVGGVDSLVDPRVVGSLARLGLLKTPDNPAGMAPGEGAAFVRLQRRSAMSPERRAIGFLSQVAWAAEETHRLADERSTGQPLLTLLRDAPPTAQDGSRLLMLSTLNGDPVRAHEWGATIVGLPSWAHTAAHVHPAMSFGDTGAAAAAMNTVFGLRTCARGRAGYTSVLVWAAGDDGGRSAIWVEPATGSIS